MNVAPETARESDHEHCGCCGRQLPGVGTRRWRPLYAAYVLILVVGLRRGEVLGLAWADVDLDRAELAVGHQLQRVRGVLLHRDTKTAASDATLPLSDICTAALGLRQARQEQARGGQNCGGLRTGVHHVVRPTGRTAQLRPVGPHPL